MDQTLSTHSARSPCKTNAGIDLQDCAALALTIRTHAVRMTHGARSSHIGSSLSMADLLAVLYNGILRVSPETIESPGRDRLILSKGHACAGLYAVLAERGFFPLDWLSSFYANGSRLTGHATTSVPGVEVSTGALGHGLPIAAGMALAGKRNQQDYRVFTILSDGECDEGSNWEAALFAPHHKLDNLIAIIDYNKIQSLGSTQSVLDLEPFGAKWTAFGWAVREIDGHDVSHVATALSAVPLEVGRPTCIIAHTVKGKGIHFMENELLWHYRSPDNDEFNRALACLKASGTSAS